MFIDFEFFGYWLLIIIGYCFISMLISVLTLFPDMFSGPLDLSIVKRAQEKRLVKIELINLRNFAEDKYGTVDDKPYGGGIGMILKVDVIDRAIEDIKQKQPKLKPRQIILLDPKGTTYNQTKAWQLTKFAHLIIVCGHYEGVDARVNQLVDELISIGNYVLTGGEIPALVLIDSLVRLIPGVISQPQAILNESFTQNQLEYPQYTRPEKYKGMEVPKVLLSGNHAQIEKWKNNHYKKIV